MTSYIGTATSRVDGFAKVTGAAKYAAEFNAPGLAYSSVVCATIAKGRITRIDTSTAMRVKGVIGVLTHENRPSMADKDEAYKDDVAPLGSPFRPLYNDKIKFNGQPIALVVAETSEIARFAASLVRVEYDQEAHVTDLHRQRDQAVPPQPPTNPLEAMFVPPKPRGAPEQALAAAATRVEGEYYVPIEHHNPMELYASTVIWEGNGKLTVYDKTQGVQNVQKYLCAVFSMKPEDVRVRSPFMGGGFGSGLRPQFQVVLAVLAARALRRSVRVVLTRQQMYVLGHRPAMIQRIAIGANAAGELDAITHEAITVTSQYEDFHRQETGWSGLLYKSAHAKYAHRLARLHLATACDMRAPSAASAVYALETAMDELAVALGLDPLELRLRCYSDRDQHENRPYSSKALRECYTQGAEAFGWARRRAGPRSMRDGSDLVGWGMATGIWEALQVPITVRITLTANGHAEVACATSDIGTGTYTIMAQVAADMLGLPIDDISIKLGDSKPSAITGRGRVVDCGIGIERYRDDRRCDPGGAVATSQADAKFTAREHRARRHRACRWQAGRQARHLSRGVDHRCHASWWGGSHRAGENHQPRPGQYPHEQHAFGDFCRGEGGRTARHHPHPPHRQRGGGRAYSEPEDRAQPGSRRRGLGHRHGAA